MDSEPVVRKWAVAVLGLLAATIASGIVLLAAFEPDVQTIDAFELVQREDDARAFLIADYFFVLLYAVLAPIAIWRFAAASGGLAWMRAAALILVAAGIVDATENTLLLSAIDSIDEDAVDAAHDLEVPKVALFVSGALLALAVNFRAFRALRAPESR